MIPSITFLFGCWFGSLLGLFLAGALSASRDQADELESFSARSSTGALAIMEKTKA